MKRGIAGIALPVAALVAWQIAAQYGHVPEYFPPPTTIAVALWDLIRTGELWPHLSASMYRIAVGLAVGALVGTCTGMLAGISRHAEAIFSPLVSLLNPVPKITILPILIVGVGLGHGSKIAAIAISVFFPTFLAAFYGVHSIPRRYVWTARSMGSGRMRTFFHVLLPACLPFVFSGVRVSVGLSFIVLFAAELLGSQAGLGYLLAQAEASVRFDLILATIAVFASLGFASDRLVLMARSRLLRGQLIGKQGAAT